MTRPDLGAALLDFGAFHTTRGNRVCHALGLPAISAAVLGALAHVPLLALPLPSALGAEATAQVEIDVALALLAVTLALDLVLNVRIALGVCALGLVLWAGARLAPWSALGALFALGWVLQLVGHRVFERNAPAFTKNVVHLFVGPRWLVNRIVRALPDRPAEGARGAP